jgi:serine protease Do
VGKADEISVKLADGRDFEASLIGADPDSDVAVIKIDAEDLSYLELADSDALEVGEWVIAIGNPFGLSHTVTAGIVSAKGRSNVGLTTYEDFIQTDAAVNPGNSGGPLLNLDGKVVGINTAIISRSGGNMGIGLAIPINMAHSIYSQLIDGGRVERGFLGVTIQDLTPQLAERFGLEDSKGVLIPEVIEESAADRAGLKHNDIIVEFQGEPVEKADAFRNKVAMLKPGTEVEVVVLRDRGKKSFKVELGERPAGGILMPGSSKLLESTGLTVQNLDDEIARRLGYEGLSGVVVTNVEPASPADKAEIRPGTLIMEVNRQPVENTREFEKALEDISGEGVVLLLLRDQYRSRYIVLKLSGK